MIMVTRVNFVNPISYRSSTLRSRMRRSPCSCRPSRRTHWRCSKCPEEMETCSTYLYCTYPSCNLSFIISLDRVFEHTRLLPLHRGVARLVREPHHLEEVEHCKYSIGSTFMFKSIRKSETSSPLADFESP